MVTRTTRNDKNADMEKDGGTYWLVNTGMDMQSGGSHRDSPSGAVLASAVAAPPLRLPAADDEGVRGG